MTIYSTMKHPYTNAFSKKYNHRAARRLWDNHNSPGGRSRVIKAFESQWRRYPNSKNVLDLREGLKTHTWIFPKGYDPTYRYGYLHDNNVFSPQPPISIMDGYAYTIDSGIREDRYFSLPSVYVADHDCPGCGEEITDSEGESGIFGSEDIPALCGPCWSAEDALIESEGTNSPTFSEAISKLLALYKSNLS